MYRKFKKVVVGLQVNVTPSNFFRRILRSEALVYKSYFFSEQPSYGNYSTLESHKITVISHAFAYSSKWRRKPWQGLFERCSQKTNEANLRQWQHTYLEKLPCLLQCFFTRTNGGKMETISRKTQCPVCKILQRYIKELKFTALLVLTK